MAEDHEAGSCTSPLHQLYQTTTDHLHHALHDCRWTLCGETWKSFHRTMSVMSTVEMLCCRYTSTCLWCALHQPNTSKTLRPCPMSLSPQMLDRDIDEAEEQLQMALREHMRNVDSLITLQDSRLQTLEVNFEEDLEALENEFAVEREQIDTQVAREREGDLASPCHHTCAQPSAQLGGLFVHEQHAQNRKELQDLIEAVAAQETYKAAEAKQVRAVRSGCYSLSLSLAL